MSQPLLGRLAPSLLLTLAVAACASGVEGKYYNTVTGEFAMELKAGKVVSAQGMEGMELIYTVKKDSLFVYPKAGSVDQALPLQIMKDGSLSAGPLGSIKRK